MWTYLKEAQLVTDYCWQRWECSWWRINFVSVWIVQTVWRSFCSLVAFILSELLQLQPRNVAFAWIIMLQNCAFHIRENIFTILECTSSHRDNHQEMAELTSWWTVETSVDCKSVSISIHCYMQLHQLSSGWPSSDVEAAVEHTETNLTLVSDRKKKLLQQQ